MKIILLKDVENLGKKYEVRNVKAGHARNFLIPEKLAKKVEEELKGVQELASSIDGQEIMIKVKVGEKDQLFESITPQKISEKLKELGFEIKKNKILLEEPIKELGEFPVKIRLEHNLESEIRVILIQEE